METLETLKQALEGRATTSFTTRALSNNEYSEGFDILKRGSNSYKEFIIPQLARLLSALKPGSPISVLEIGPGPESVLGQLPDHLRRKIGWYSAFERNELFFSQLKLWFHDFPLFRLESPPSIRPGPFSNKRINADNKFDLILFCHSMYGMNPKDMYIKMALEMLAEGDMVVVFHRASLHFDGLVCHEKASFPTGVVRVQDDDETLDSFVPLIAGCVPENVEDLRDVWRYTCRNHGRREGNHLLFSSPEIMMAFDHHATALSELTALVLPVDKTVKNREAPRHPAAVVRPNNIRQVQQCVEWARKHKVGLTVIGGGHSGHCLQSNVVSVDMEAFEKVHILKDTSLVVAEAGCKTGDIIQQAMDEGLTVPLGSRPSVGAGLWLQGGIGHLARLHCLACDSVVGAVMVSVDSGQVLCIGHVPSQHQPAGAIRPEDEAEMFWALKGAGTNFGIVISVTLKAHPAPTYRVRSWILALEGENEMQQKLYDVDVVAAELPRTSSIDAYLYCVDERQYLGVTMFETRISSRDIFHPKFGKSRDSQIVDGVELFDTEMYMSTMHGGHRSSKTSSFKRCVFLKAIAADEIADLLAAAMEDRPSPLCYLHLLHGGGAVRHVSERVTAFGCRDWDFACVVTGVWPRDKDGTRIARDTMQWVYDVAKKLLPVSAGVYGADLGPDPRDMALAARAFGPNRPRLARLKRRLDPGNVLAYACPLLADPKLIILVTGKSGAGKDHCADIWASVFSDNAVKARAVSISDVTKREYAAATGVDFERLLSDREHKLGHREAMTKLFQDKVKQQPDLPAKHFRDVVTDAADVDVLLITGMRDEKPVATFSHLVPDSQLIEVRVEASEETRRGRYGSCSSKKPNWAADLTFDNETTGDESPKAFANLHLLPLCDDLQRLAGMVTSVPGFPRPGFNFRHVLNITQRPGGLSLCTSLLKSHFAGDWDKVDFIVPCEAGGFLFAAPLALEVDVPLALIRDAGKLPPETVSISKDSSHISALLPRDARLPPLNKFEMNKLPSGASVVVVDDVLAKGHTLFAVLQLLRKAGARMEDVSVMVVAELPHHMGREFLRVGGFGGVRIQSLLAFDGA